MHQYFTRPSRINEHMTSCTSIWPIDCITFHSTFLHVWSTGNRFLCNCINPSIRNYQFWNCIFLKKRPTGWDNEGKINILLENSTTIKSDSEYSDIIPRPSLRKPAQRDVETVIAVEDQDFLSKLQLVLNKASTPSVKQVIVYQ